MVFNKRFLGVALAAPLALSACSGDGGTFDLNLLHQDCTGQIDFLPPSAELTIRVSGDGMSDVVQRAAVSAGSVELPEVPFGSNRVVTVDVNAGGKLVAMGRSAPFEVSDGDTPNVTVVVQGVNRFTGASDTANNCVEMTTQRAGHTAVLLKDKRVLLVGGFKKLENSGIGTGYVATAEVFDPSVGSFVPVAAPCDGEVCYDVGMGAGVALPDGRVLVAGGERSTDGAAATAVDTAMIYDPAAKKWTAKKMLSARRGHTMHLIGNKVLVVGGLDASNKVLTSTEIFDPATGEFTVEGAPEIPSFAAGNGEQINRAGRAFHSGAMTSDTTLVIGGGIDETGSIARSLLFFTANKNGAITPVKSAKSVLPTGVVLGSAGTVNGNFVLVGGSSDFNPATMRYRAQGATDLAQWTEPSTSAEAPRTVKVKDKRIAPCAVQMDANRLLVAGGINVSNSVTADAEVISWNGSRRTIERNFIGDSELRSSMALERAFPTCTNLGDGRILVSGGSDKDGNASPSAEIFVIRPL